MNSPIGIRQLTEREVAALTGASKFNTLRPVRCTCCGNTCDFARRVFNIQGVPKTEQSSDSAQALIAGHLKERHAAESVFFKTFRGKFYADSAVCSKCGSTVVVFDIELTDEILTEVSRRTGRPIEQVRADIEILSERIAKNERKAKHT